MNSSKNDEEALPDGWVLCQSKSVPGRKYYFNKKTGKSSWTRPQADEKSRSNKKDKNKPEETEKKNLKRKNDSLHEDTTPKKRSAIKETTTPEIIRNQRQVSETFPVQSKGSANKRLQLLRKQITEDAQKEDSLNNKTLKSPIKYNSEQKKASPKNLQNDNFSKTSSKSTFELKSPTFNDSKCSTTTQSPSSDSLQSIPSPSQFFAANKILSSMKAQLPDEYSNKVKAKDTFADIDRAICNQTPEYPSTKHPATPPQFSEASKIVSAIKSKLSYRSLMSAENNEVKSYTSAKDRMESLRESLTKDAEEGIKTRLPVGEAMDIDITETRITPPPTSPPPPKVEKSNKGNLILVVDTNVFIHELDFIKNILNSHLKGYKEQPTLIVPWRVINELDRLKDNNNGNGAICKRARTAMDYLYQSLPENDKIKGQSLRDANSHIYPCEVPDDEILNCSLQQAERGKSVILLSNDKNLCSKAIINGVKSIGMVEMKKLLENQPPESTDPDLETSLKHYQNSIYHLLSNILENEMRAKYDTLWQHVLFKAPPWSLRDVLLCLLKHWMAVFSEVFPRIQDLFVELKNTLHDIEKKGFEKLTKSDVNTFKELSLEVARKCQIIPEYMELAKLTVERISRRTDQSEVISGGDEMAVIAAFENVWTVLSSYCAKLSSGLGIHHSIEDKINNDEPLSELTNKWTVYSTQIYDLTNTIKGVLNISNDSEQAVTEHIGRLERVFKDSLRLTSVDSCIVNRDNLRLFCNKCRNMLQEACTKFSQLAELLDVCRSVIHARN